MREAALLHFIKGLFDKEKRTSAPGTLDSSAHGGRGAGAGSASASASREGSLRGGSHFARTPNGSTHGGAAFFERSVHKGRVFIAPVEEGPPAPLHLAPARETGDTAPAPAPKAAAAAAAVEDDTETIEPPPTEKAEPASARGRAAWGEGTAKVEPAPTAVEPEPRATHEARAPEAASGLPVPPAPAARPVGFFSSFARLFDSTASSAAVVRNLPRVEPPPPGEVYPHGISHHQGPRDSQEDVYVVQPFEGGGKVGSFFGVFDGHAGLLAAQGAAHLLRGAVERAADQNGGNLRCGHPPAPPRQRPSLGATHLLPPLPAPPFPRLPPPHLPALPDL
eukprot:tig00000403_g344.t1